MTVQLVSQAYDHICCCQCILKYEIKVMLECVVSRMPVSICLSHPFSEYTVSGTPVSTHLSCLVCLPPFSWRFLRTYIGLGRKRGLISY